MTSLEQSFKTAVSRVTDERGKPATLGKPDGTLYWVDPNGMTHRTRVWARIGEQNSNQVVVVDCTNVTPQIDMPVRVDYKNGVLTVIDVDGRRAVEFGGGRPPGSVGAHAWLHSRLGPDPVYIEGLQYLPLLVTPTNPPDLTVTVQAGTYYDTTGALQVYDTAVSGSTSAYVPVSGAHFVIICLNRATGAIVIVDGTDVSGGGDALFPGASVTAAEIEAVTISADYHPLAVVLLVAGQTQIKAKDIVRDLRPVGSTGGGGVPGGSDTQVQFNDGGAFGGSANFTWDDTANQLLVGGATAVSANSVAEFHDAYVDTALIIANDTASADLNTANIGFYLKNSAEAFEPFGGFGVGAIDRTDGTEDGYFVLSTMIAGTNTPLLYFSSEQIILNYLARDTDTIIQGDTATKLAVFDAGLDAVQIGTTTAGNIADFRSSGVVINESGDDRDFRIEGDTNQNLFFVDAGNDRVGIGTATPGSTVHIVGNTTIEAATQNYLISGRTDRLAFVGQTTGNNAGMEFFTNDGDGTDNIAITIYGAGLYTDITNRERMFFNYSPATAFQIYSEAAGTGTLRPIRIGMSTITTQLELQTNGNVNLGGTGGALILNRLTTTQQNALTGVNGMIIYNTSTNKVRAYVSGAWVDLH